MSASFLSMIDLFGTPIQMNMNRKHKIKSHLGGFCTIIFVGILIFSLVTASKELFAKTNPKIITSQRYSSDAAEMILSIDDFPLGFGLQAPSSFNNVPFINTSIYTMVIQHVLDIKTQLPNGTSQETFTYTDLATELCTPDYFGELAPEFQDVVLNTVYCISKEQPALKEISLQGVYASSVFKYILVQVTPCKNTTNSSNCAPPDVIETYLSGAWFNMLYGNMGVDPTNLTHPNSRYRDVISQMISPANYVELNLDISNVQVSSDLGWLLDDVKVKTYQQVSNVQNSLQFEPDADGVLIRFGVAASKLEISYSRVYKKIQDVLAEISGVFNIAFVVALVLTTHYSRLKFKETVMNELFCINTQPEKDDPANRLGVKRRRRSNLAKVSIEPRNQRPSISIFNPEKDTNAAQRVKSKKKQEVGESVKHIEIPMTSSIYVGESMTLKESRTRPLISLKKNNVLFKELQTREPIKSPQEPDMTKRLSILSVASRKNSRDFLNDMNTVKDSALFSHRASSLKDLEANDEIKLTRNRRSSTLKPFDLSLKMINENDSESHKQQIFTLESALEKPDEENGKDRQQDEQEKQEKQNEENEESSSENEKEEEEEPYHNQEQANFDREMDAIYSDQEILKHIGVGVEQEKINLTVWEYISSIFYQTEEVRKKLKLLRQGIRKIDERLNVVNILKKLREVDKLKALLLANDEFVLFNNLPKPEISLHNPNTRRSSFSMTILRRPTFIHDDTTDQILKAHKRIRRKEEKTAIEERILQIFENKD